MMHRTALNFVVVVALVGAGSSSASTPWDDGSTRR